MFAGWQAQYDFSEFLTLGSELYFHTAATTEDKAITGFTIGGSLNFTEHIHLIFQADIVSSMKIWQPLILGFTLPTDSKMWKLCKYFFKIIDHKR